MNFLDTYGITGSGVSTPPQTEQPEQSLNEEVSQVIGQLGRFWGGFRKQSESALATARKDLTQVVTQAQKELNKLTAETPGDDPNVTNEETESEQQPNAQAGPSSDGADSPTTPIADVDTTPSSSQTFFSRLQSSLPPNIVSTVQTHIPEGLRNAPQNIDFTQLRTTLSSEFQRVQGVTRAQAEEYVHKSELLLKDAIKEAGDVLRDAVKVIPPEEGSSTSGAIWDGSDVWMLPTPPGEADGRSSSSIKGKGKETDSGPSSRRHSEDAQRAAATRAELLLKRLNYDPETIMADPADEEGVKELYAKWIQEARGDEQGTHGQDWSERIQEALAEPTDGEALNDTFNALVPSQMTEEVFWERYFFRVHQIEQEEERRKVLLRGTMENEEDFSWEDDEDDSVSKPTEIDNLTSASQRTLAAPRALVVTEANSAPSSHAHTPATLSPRESSEESYDLVSSGNVSVAGEGHETSKDEGDDDDADSDVDWE
ncbi:hypothetical protein SERLA73DRAFT_180097 [Serpula lacrymans var. lacrymans S7.3]|uniref:BSD domain-containing protein n=2 Tax=Serpula lacrymans var. lacrymans TaxID=341189 RepID=F8PVN3_SERL3|nr:uncharacterized protein SERLADRAFT_448399 [Serpula lacrymans var. lacrymans S7.9]EGN99850.1 hypothetical protein SERLA73DRAFT_180097 [Serpula lacrymans var. lacrymans S7.3]EGO25418.1 hypothetical protein SERLADRAFT_448399 [Serpula lacrymans var. lacrymans S7.9]